MPFAPDKQTRHRDTVLVAKQPIFDLQDRIWGYELLFRNPRSGVMEGEGDAATSTVMIEGFELLRPILQPRQRFCINFTAAFLEAELPGVLPPDICVIEILEDTAPTEAVLGGISNLKKQGYTIALDDYTGQPELKAFLPLADIVKVEVLGRSEEEIGRLTRQLALYPARLLAEKVETPEMAACCRSLGFTLFQGHYFSKAEVVRGKKLNPAQVTRTRLLGLLSSKELNMAQIVKVVSTDVFIAYNLLKFVNSVYFGLPTKVGTVERAAMLLGTRKMRQWLFVTALAGMDSSPMAQELVHISAFRAKFLESLALRSGLQAEQASRLFLAGLFSLLQRMMQIPLEEIFASVSLPEDVLRVLVHADGPLAPWFGVMLAYEAADWNAVKRYAATLGLKDADLSAAYVEAGAWSAAMFRASSASGDARRDSGKSGGNGDIDTAGR